VPWKWRPLTAGASRGQPPKEALNSIELKKRIIETPAAIGYIELNMVDPSLRVVLVQ
jgi:hypothetical protein